MRELGRLAAPRRRARTLLALETAFRDLPVAGRPAGQRVPRDQAAERLPAAPTSLPLFYAKVPDGALSIGPARLAGLRARARRAVQRVPELRRQRPRAALPARPRRADAGHACRARSCSRAPRRRCARGRCRRADGKPPPLNSKAPCSSQPQPDLNTPSGAAGVARRPAPRARRKPLEAVAAPRGSRSWRGRRADEAAPRSPLDLADPGHHGRRPGVRRLRAQQAAAASRRWPSATACSWSSRRPTPSRPGWARRSPSRASRSARSTAPSSKDGRGVLSVSIDPEELPHVYADATAQLVPNTPLKDMQIRLHPGSRSARALPDGAHDQRGRHHDPRRLRRAAARARLRHARVGADHDRQPRRRACKGRKRDLNSVLRSLGPTAAQLRQISGLLADRRKQIPRAGAQPARDHRGHGQQRRRPRAGSSTPATRRWTRWPRNDESLQRSRSSCCPGRCARRAPRWRRTPPFARSLRPHAHRARPVAEARCPPRCASAPDSLRGIVPLPAAELRRFIDGVAPAGQARAARLARPGGRHAAADQGVPGPRAGPPTSSPTSRARAPRATCSGWPGSPTTRTRCCPPRTPTARWCAASRSSRAPRQGVSPALPQLLQTVLGTPCVRGHAVITRLPSRGDARCWRCCSSLTSVLLTLFVWRSVGGVLPLQPQAVRGPRAVRQRQPADQERRRPDLRRERGLGGRGHGRAGCAPRPRSRSTREYAPLPDDVRAILRQKTLLGETFVALSPGQPQGPAAGRRRADPHVADRADTQPLDRVLGTLDPPTRERMRALLTNTATMVDGRAQDVNDSLGNLAVGTRQLGGRGADPRSPARLGRSAWCATPARCCRPSATSRRRCRSWCAPATARCRPRPAATGS